MSLPGHKIGALGIGDVRSGPGTQQSLARRLWRAEQRRETRVCAMPPGEHSDMARTASALLPAQQKSLLTQER